MLQVTVKVDGMMCGMCEAHTKDAVRKVFPSARKISASASSGQVEFQLEENLPLPMLKHDLKAELDAMGYRLMEISADEIPEEEKGGFFSRLRYRK